MAEADTAAAANSTSVTFTLTEPIARGDATIGVITLRKPKAGELRGLKVEELFATDVNTLFLLLPRISQPTLTAQDIAGLDTEDLLEIAGAVKGFFLNAATRAAIAKAVGA